MVLFQLVCLIFLPLAYAVQIRLNRETIVLAPMIFIASWIGEATSVHFYEFYIYPEHWWFRVAGVPLMVPVIWPLVILSGREVVRALWPGNPRREALLVGAMVFIDAALIEVVAVNCGLWHWTQPGYLNVPLIGVLGWAFFGYTVALLLNRWEGPKRWWVIVAAPVILHLMLVSSWWVLFRWVLRGNWFWLFVAVLAVFTLAVLAVRNIHRMSMRIAGVRLIAAGIFIGLLLFAEPTAWRVWLHVGLTSIPYALATEFY